MDWEGDGDLRVTVANLMIVLDNGMTSLMTASLEGQEGSGMKRQVRGWVRWRNLLPSMHKQCNQRSDLCWSGIYLELQVD